MAIVLLCDHCLSSLTIHGANDPASIEAFAAREGWQVAEDHCVCPGHRHLANENVLEAQQRILGIIDERRTAEGDPNIGSAIERAILRDAMGRVQSKPKG